jgi:hypothetical protein
MSVKTWRPWRPGLLVLALIAGCSSKPAGPAPTAATAGPSEDESAQVRRRFAELEAAIKAHDAGRIWDLLCTRSQSDAERIARAARDAYAKAGPDEKTQQAQAFGLSDQQLTELTGKDVINGKRFRKKFDDLPGSKVEGVSVEKESATIRYTDTEGDHEKLIFLRQGGAWKAWLTIPRLAAPAPTQPPPRDKE